MGAPRLGLNKIHDILWDKNIIPQRTYLSSGKKTEKNYKGGITMVVKIFSTDTFEMIRKKVPNIYEDIVKEVLLQYILNGNVEFEKEFEVPTIEYVQVKDYIPYSVAGVYAGVYNDYEEYEVTKNVTVAARTARYNDKEDCIEIIIAE